IIRTHDPLEQEQEQEQVQAREPGQGQEIIGINTVVMIVDLVKDRNRVKMKMKRRSIVTIRKMHTMTMTTKTQTVKHRPQVQARAQALRRGEAGVADTASARQVQTMLVSTIELPLRRRTKIRAIRMIMTTMGITMEKIKIHMQVQEIEGATVSLRSQNHRH